MSKNFDFKGRLAGNNFGQQMNTQAASVVSTLAGRTAKDSGWTKKFQVLDIPLTKLHEYPEQKVFSMDEAELEQLTENVRSSGILQPLIVRVHPTIQGDFEIVAGHRRREAARRAGMETVPCQVYMGMTDEEAKTVFYATNMGQRSELLPSERAAGYKALAEVLRLEGNGAVSEVAKIGSEGKRTVYRYMRLMNLEKPLLDKVDKKEISVYAGAALADLTPTAQMNLLAVLEQHDQDGITEKAAKEVAALQRHDVETIDRCLFPTREKKVTAAPRAAKLKLSPKRFDHYFVGLDTEEEKLDYLEAALIAYSTAQKKGDGQC